MSLTSPHINPGPIPKQDLEILSFQIAGLLKELTDKPMFAEEAYTWAGWGKSKFFDLVNKGVIKGHLKEHGHPVYLRSEIIEAIKKA